MGRLKGLSLFLTRVMKERPVEELLPLSLRGNLRPFTAFGATLGYTLEQYIKELAASDA